MARTSIRRSLVLASALSMLAVAAPAADAATRFVDDDHQQCPQAVFTSVQPAIDASAPGDKVVVCNGAYDGAVSIGPGKDGLRLTSQVKWGATLMPVPGGAADIVSVEGSHDVRILKFRLVGGPVDGCAKGIVLHDDASATIRGNRISDVTQTCGEDGAVGIVVGTFGDARATIIDNVIERVLGTVTDDFYPINGNPVWGATGIRVSNPGSYAHISRNTIDMPAGGVGIYLASSNAEIENNRIIGAHDAVHGDGGGGQVSPISRGTQIHHNRLTDGVNGVVIGNYWNQTGYPPYNNYGPAIPARLPDRIAANRIHDNTGAGILIGGFDLITGLRITKNIVQHNRTGIELVHALRPFIGEITTRGNNVSGNDARFNDVRDCFEGIYDGFYPNGTPTPTGTLENVWFHNRGKQAVLPAGICT